MYGERCHFRHEFRQFNKLHKHFYLVHIKAMTFYAPEILVDSHKKDFEKETENED